MFYHECGMHNSCKVLMYVLRPGSQKKNYIISREHTKEIQIKYHDVGYAITCKLSFQLWIELENLILLAIFGFSFEFHVCYPFINTLFLIKIV